MQAFMLNLMAALQQAGSSNSTNSSSSDSGGPAFTKDQLTSMASSLAATDPARAADMTKLANNFSQADTNGDGKLSAQEAMAFDQANSSSSSTSNASAYQTTSKIEADIQNLIQELTSSTSSSGTTSTSNSGTTSSALSDLQTSFQNLINALNGSGSTNSSSTSSLETFLSNLASNLEGSSSTGNIVATKA